MPAGTAPQILNRPLFLLPLSSPRLTRHHPGSQGKPKQKPPRSLTSSSFSSQVSSPSSRSYSAPDGTRLAGITQTPESDQDLVFSKTAIRKTGTTCRPSVPADFTRATETPNSVPCRPHCIFHKVRFPTAKREVFAVQSFPRNYESVCQPSPVMSHINTCVPAYF